ncbi:DUF397 domain-containing protein [Nocardia sp. NBC_01499]|uniref:DUF397 domain-containing protein n=1 Tax=Nocardia sp. NBC_01499 TaxID=2903597 RepID=UPI00386A4684
MGNGGETGHRGWFKSSFSKDANSCVEVRFSDDGTVHIRDSKYQGRRDDQPTIAIPADDWDEFLRLAADGDESPSELIVPVVEHDEHTGSTTVRDAVGTKLVYTAREWNAFTSGIRAAEFALTSA